MQNKSKFLVIKAIGKVVLPSKRGRELFHRTISLILFPYHRFLIRKASADYQKNLKRIKEKSLVKVAFLVVHSSVWKFDELYTLFENDERFEPTVVICPYIIYGKKAMLHEMEMAYKLFNEKGFRVVSTLNADDESWVNIKKTVNPDIVFFTNPHNQSRREFWITNFLDRLTCYIPYGFMISNVQQNQFNQLFHNLLWHCFYETPMHDKMAKQYARNKGQNVVVTGYPVGDQILSREPTTYLWKVQDRECKRIIWAPHHTIEDDNEKRGFSTFLEYHEVIFDIIEKFPNRVQIAFKPHPGLMAKLNHFPGWGVTRTAEYFNRWKNHPKGMLCEGEYIDLFKSSDALIHDSISFIAEYCYTGKPTLFLVRDNTVFNKFNEFGKIAFETQYLSHSINETLTFIEKVVLEGDDPMSNQRQNFREKYLTPPNACTASENIYLHIKNQL